MRLTLRYTTPDMRCRDRRYECDGGITANDHVQTDGDELHRVLVWSDISGHNHHSTVSVWKPFSDVDTSRSDDVTVWNMQFHAVKQAMIIASRCYCSISTNTLQFCM